MTFQPPTDCDLCNATLTELRNELVYWPDAPKGMQYAWIPRCLDQAGCRARVEAAGGVWPENVRKAG